MGIDCVNKFGGYFRSGLIMMIHTTSSGNMSIRYTQEIDTTVENYGELGRQDESYYIVATGHGIRCLGFNEEIAQMIH